MADGTAEHDDFPKEVDRVLRQRQGAAFVLAGVTLSLAVALSILSYGIVESAAREQLWTTAFVRDWASWTTGWATTAQVNATVIGLLTAILTLFVATALQSIGPDISVSGAASRILLDDVTLLACIAGAVSAWVLAPAAGWHSSTALAWAPALGSAVLLSVLAVSTEARLITRRQSHWALLRASERLERAVGTAPRRPWIRAVPWLGVAGAAGLATAPAAIGLVLAYRDSLLVVPLAVIVVALSWSVLIGTSWDSSARLSALRVRHDRFPAEAALTLLCAGALVCFLGLVTCSVADAWGVVSFALAVLLGLATLVLPWHQRLRECHLHRQLSEVEKELDHVSTQLAATSVPPASPPPPPPPSSVLTSAPPADDHDWVLELAGRPVLRLRRAPRQF